ncbi:SCO family protein [Evansella halocellulosilytica]|uniref:SCO family protein n=1 Tax=Evansella halocellulosilytica TaxID=2011013 RepID=UPI000BB93D4C|nr:SCO family protein [Evansella halocellulosilytica]
MSYWKSGLLFISMVFLSGCSFLYQEPQPPESNAIIDVTQSEEDFEVTEFSAVNQNGEEMTNEDLEGEWWLAKTIFTRCPTVCMTMTPNMVSLQEELIDRDLDVRIVSFTVDPEFDTPERLEDYGESYGANFENWDFVTGYSEEDLQDFVLASFKANIQAIPEQNDIMHPTRFYLMNRDGEIVRFYDGDSSFELDPIIDDIEFLLTAEE